MKDYAKIDTSPKPTIERQILDSIAFIVSVSLIMGLIALCTA